MGAKSALLAFAEGDIRSALASPPRAERDDVEALVRRVHPDRAVEPTGEGTLLDYVYPPDGTTYATALPGVDIVCDQRFMIDRPSELPAHLIEIAGDRRMVLHAMHSSVDWFAFAVWENGELVRSLSLSPDGGVGENIGEPYEFEVPYWEGRHPVPVDEGEEPYALPFHPLDLAEDVLRALFGFILEGRADRSDIDGDAVHLYGFRMTERTDEEQAQAARLADAVRKMAPPQRFGIGPDGKLQPITDPHS